MLRPSAALSYNLGLENGRRARGQLETEIEWACGRAAQQQTHLWSGLELGGPIIGEVNNSSSRCDFVDDEVSVSKVDVSS
jgi:hypothetical protein